MRSVVGVSVAVVFSVGAVLGAAAPSVAAAEPVPNGRAISLSKTVGDVMGGEHITIRGWNLRDTTQVCFGQGCVPVTSATFWKVEVTAPPHYGYQGGQAQAVVPDYQEGDVAVTLKQGDKKTANCRRSYRYKALTATGREMSYLLAHWEKYDSARYGNFDPVGGDCMNFVSAGLAEWFGRNSHRPDWYNAFADWVAKHPTANPYNDPYGKIDPANRWVTPSWAYVPDFSTWLNDQKDSFGITRTDLSNDPATWSDIKVGDIVTMTWNNDGGNGSTEGGPGLDPGRIPAATTAQASNDLGEDHAMVVTRIVTVDGHLDVQLAGHSNDRNYLSFSAIYSGTPNMTGSIWHLPTA
ncbi:hypothetical protein ATY41_11630 [Leifsonia xyli subsp. xyli]|nr:amidase domain-containing protein [Leifsonia xyli]ODA89924.1 hypothetical protein ATY41_11630 [Leifsonia xyli subsp. xyli]